MSPERYWVSQAGRATGPFEKVEVKQMWDAGKITAEDLVCPAHSSEWRHLATAELSIAAAKPEPEPAPAPTPTSAPAAESASQAPKFPVSKLRPMTASAHRPVKPDPLVERKNPRLAFVISLLLPGAGQFYTGQVLHGLFWLLCWGAVTYFTQGMAWPVVGLVSGLLAAKAASAANAPVSQGEPVVEPVPQDRSTIVPRKKPQTTSP